MRAKDRPHLWKLDGRWHCRIPFAGLNYVRSGVYPEDAYLAASSYVFTAMSELHIENERYAARSRATSHLRGLYGLAPGQQLEERN